MRVPKERMEARARIEDLEYRFERVMEVDDDYFEIESALVHVLARIKNIQLIDIYPIPEETDEQSLHEAAAEVSLPRSEAWVSNLKRCDAVMTEGECGLAEGHYGPHARDKE